jgi:hypothetical protein
MLRNGNERGINQSKENLKVIIPMQIMTDQNQRGIVENFTSLSNITTNAAGCTREINALNTKRRLLYLKTQFVRRSKHFSSRL